MPKKSMNMLKLDDQLRQGWPTGSEALCEEYPKVMHIVVLL